MTMYAIERPINIQQNTVNSLNGGLYLSYLLCIDSPDVL